MKANRNDNFIFMICHLFVVEFVSTKLRKIIKSGGFVEYENYTPYMIRTGKFSFKNSSLLNVIEVLHIKLYE